MDAPGRGVESRAAAVEPVNVKAGRLRRAMAR